MGGEASAAAAIQQIQKRLNKKPKIKERTLAGPFSLSSSKRGEFGGVYIYMCVYKAWSALARSRDSTVRENIYKRERGGDHCCVCVSRDRKTVPRRLMNVTRTQLLFPLQNVISNKKPNNSRKKEKESRPATVFSCFLFLFLGDL
jgi:hypothetical protein